MSCVVAGQAVLAGQVKLNKGRGDSLHKFSVIYTISQFTQIIDRTFIHLKRLGASHLYKYTL